MQEKYPNPGINDFLTKHIKRMEATKNHILREFYDEQTDERDNFKQMIDQYLNQIKRLTDGKPDYFLEDQWPLILIGSTVEVQDLNYNEIERLRIVPPFYEERVEGLDCASFLSPVGYALLLKKVGDRVEVNTPLGSCQFMINSIEIPTV